MMRSRAALALALGFCVCSETPPADGTYLPPRLVPNGVQILPPPPARGSAANAADRAIFKSTRRLRGSTRWRIAADDVENSPLDRYACAMKMALTARSAPALAHLLDKAGTGDVIDPVKKYYHTSRPYLRDAGPICQARTLHLDQNGDYPSGHAANGWLEALILASLIPNRASQILTRGRQYGESRIVCGVHSASAVQAGWIAGSATFAALSGSAGFQRDSELAREEIASIGPTAPRPDVTRCAAEAMVLSQRQW